QQHQHQPTPVPPFAVAVRESVAAASRTKQRRRSSSVGDLSKELEKFELQLQQLQEHMPAKDCSIVIDEQWNRNGPELLFHKKPPISAKAFASQSKRLLQQQQQKTSDSMMSATAYISPAVSTDFSHEMLAWYDSHRQRVLLQLLLLTAIAAPAAAATLLLPLLHLPGLIGLNWTASCDSAHTISVSSLSPSTPVHSSLFCSL
uniref:BZIP domain-containing protein n=1 Tax=Macrostomum lignano TaxID=282301 RepID=A0A1I8FHE0_9PLAT